MATCNSLRATAAMSSANPIAASDVDSTTGSSQVSCSVNGQFSGPQRTPNNQRLASNRNSVCPTDSAKQGTILPMRICPRVSGAVLQAPQRALAPLGHEHPTDDQHQKEHEHDHEHRHQIFVMLAAIAQQSAAFVVLVLAAPRPLRGLPPTIWSATPTSCRADCTS